MELDYGLTAAEEIERLERQDEAGELAGPGRERLAQLRIAQAHERQQLEAAKLADVAYMSTVSYELGHQVRAQANRADLRLNKAAAVVGELSALLRKEIGHRLMLEAELKRLAERLARIEGETR